MELLDARRSLMMRNTDPNRLPDPALIVLVGASGSGKSTWAGRRYRAAEVVSSDDLRGVVGSGRHDLDATDDAFALLDLIVAGRVGRGLTTVVDTLGLDTERRRGYLELGRRHALPTVVVRFAVPSAVCRRRNAERDRPVPAPVLARQLRSAAEVSTVLDAEGWDHVIEVSGDDPTIARADPAPITEQPGTGLDVVLQVSRFPWRE